jgi:rare lipoprotein A (peptidoglycan hydrolase)
VKVPVIDRGPYSGNREFDLTAATKSALRFPDVGTVLTSR